MLLFLATVVVTVVVGLFGAYSNGGMVVEGAADVIEGASRHSSASWKVTEDAYQDRLDELQKDGTGAGMLQALGGAAKVVKGTTGLAGSPTTTPNPIGLGFGDGTTLADVAFTGSTFSAPAPADTATQPSEAAQDGGSSDDRGWSHSETTQPETTQPEPDSTDRGPDGTYFLQPGGYAAMLVRAGDLEWHRYSNYITVDSDAASGYTIEGFIANGPDPDTDEGFTTQYEITSTQVPWWDDDQGLWQVSAMVSRDGGPPELTSGYITRTGSIGFRVGELGKLLATRES